MVRKFVVAYPLVEVAFDLASVALAALVVEAALVADLASVALAALVVEVASVEVALVALVVGC